MTLPLTPEELLSTTRAVRRRLDFDRPLELALVRECLQLAIQAPSGSNAQGWHFVVVTDPAVKLALGDHASRVMVSSSKSMTGHLLGAAGGVEAVFSALTRAHQVVPPTINLHEPDEGCDLDYVPNTAREATVKVALSNSFGFGGTNGTVIFGKL